MGQASSGTQGVNNGHVGEPETSPSPCATHEVAEAPAGPQQAPRGLKYFAGSVYLAGFLALAACLLACCFLLFSLSFLPPLSPML